MEFWYFIFGYAFSWLEDLLVLPIRRKWQKECKYDCSKCKVWDCQYKLCNEKRRKYVEK